MASTLVIRDETTAGGRSEAATLTFPTERITVRELIRERVYQEVQDFNRAAGRMHFTGLVQPTGAEAVLHGFRLKARREIDWKEQFDSACEAFEANRILVLVGETQAESLEDEIVITRGVEVTFLKLLPLVGG